MGSRRTGRCSLPCKKIHLSASMRPVLDSVSPDLSWWTWSPPPLVRTGTYRQIFQPEMMITGNQNTGNIYASGYNPQDRQILERVLDRIRKQTEGCISLQGFLVFHNLGGGTGSGFTSLLMEHLAAEYNKRKMQLSVLPSLHEHQVTAPYNSILATHATMEPSDVLFLFENEAVFNICSTHLGIQSPTFKDVNRLISRIISSMTAAQRFGGSPRLTFNEIVNNLVPYPRYHFAAASYAPAISPQMIGFFQDSVYDLATSCIDPRRQVLNTNPLSSRYLACLLLYQGNVVDQHVANTFSTLRERYNLQFVNWGPIFSKGIANMPWKVPSINPAYTERSLCMLSNTTGLRHVWTQLSQRFEAMYRRRAFVNWYLNEGMQEEDFDNAIENINNLCHEYESEEHPR
ncbi:tubulin alpha-1B chain-like isoform X2 [Nelusetta ayraudi]|uniref:tubulin alpha-1B chain-like isoform X2 n=1 Tax=Nelusetta ayraudi TaxID=303726 RepID=UPI003F71D0A8